MAIARIEVAEQAALFREDRVLLLWLEREDESGYQLPGGRLDEGEPAGDALIREIGEETGFRMERDAFALYRTAIFCPSRPKYGVFFAADAPDADVVLSEDHDSYRWASRDEIDDLDFLFDEVKDATIAAFELRRP